MVKHYTNFEITPYFGRIITFITISALETDSYSHARRLARRSDEYISAMDGEHLERQRSTQAGDSSISGEI